MSSHKSSHQVMAALAALLMSSIAVGATVAPDHVAAVVAPEQVAAASVKVMFYV